MKIKGEIEDLKILKSLKKEKKKKRRKNNQITTSTTKKERMVVKIVKIYLGLFLVVVWAVWGQFISGQFLGLAYISQDL